MLDWDEEGDGIERKYAALTTILRIITKSERLEDLMQVLDMKEYQRVERDLNKFMLTRIRQMTPRGK